MNQVKTTPYPAPFPGEKLLFRLTATFQYTFYGEAYFFVGAVNTTNPAAGAAFATR